MNDATETHTAGRLQPVAAADTGKPQSVLLDATAPVQMRSALSDECLDLPKVVRGVRGVHRVSELHAGARYHSRLQRRAEVGGEADCAWLRRVEQPQTLQTYRILEHLCLANFHSPLLHHLLKALAAGASPQECADLIARHTAQPIGCAPWFESDCDEKLFS